MHPREALILRIAQLLQQSPQYGTSLYSWDKLTDRQRRQWLKTGEEVVGWFEKITPELLENVTEQNIGQLGL
jgi:hypothetical protein